MPKSNNRCLGLQMARMEMDCILKILGSFFKFIASLLETSAKTLIIVYFLFENSFDIFLLVFYKHFMYDKGV